MASRTFFASFADPGIFTLLWSCRKTFIHDDVTGGLWPERYKTLNSLEEMRRVIQALHPDEPLPQMDFTYTAHPLETYLHRERLSAREFLGVLDCCDLTSENPQEAIDRTNACWKNLFKDQ